MLWQHPAHGEVLRACYRAEFSKDADNEEDDINGLDGDAYEKTLKGETECSEEELADRRCHAEVVSQHALQTLCVQMKCKGILVLGEIVDSEAEDVFISMVQEGALLGHPNVDFPTWTPLRSKALLQAFTDFLVACKKAETGEPPLHGCANTSAAPCVKCRCGRSCAKCGRGRLAQRLQAKGGERRKRGQKEPGEREVEDSGAEEEDEEDEWSGGGSDAEREDDPLANNDDGDQDDHHDTPPPPPSLRYPPNLLLQRRWTQWIRPSTTTGSGTSTRSASTSLTARGTLRGTRSSSARSSRRTPAPRWASQGPDTY
ncbi:hypothetical protein B0H14DRAFT_2622035 [Mycena olivaceomarginata]|nr:hypothetical protein B0H14DRAFT_2622035 [Mycena olivaceomarginata]